VSILNYFIYYPGSNPAPHYFAGLLLYLCLFQLLSFPRIHVCTSTSHWVLAHYRLLYSILSAATLSVSLTLALCFAFSFSTGAFLFLGKLTLPLWLLSHSQPPARWHPRCYPRLRVASLWLLDYIRSICLPLGAPRPPFASFRTWWFPFLVPGSYARILSLVSSSSTSG
jgi:hypothetical protein